MRSDVTEQFIQEIVSTLLPLFLVCAGILLLFGASGSCGFAPISPGSRKRLLTSVCHPPCNG